MILYYLLSVICSSNIIYSSRLQAAGFISVWPTVPSAVLSKWCHGNMPWNVLLGIFQQMWFCGNMPWNVLRGRGPGHFPVNVVLWEYWLTDDLMTDVPFWLWLWHQESSRTSQELRATGDGILITLLYFTYFIVLTYFTLLYLTLLYLRLETLEAWLETCFTCLLSYLLRLWASALARLDWAGWSLAFLLIPLSSLELCLLTILLAWACLLTFSRSLTFFLSFLFLLIYYFLLLTCNLLPNSYFLLVIVLATATAYFIFMRFCNVQSSPVALLSTFTFFSYFLLILILYRLPARLITFLDSGCLACFTVLLACIMSCSILIIASCFLALPWEDRRAAGGRAGQAQFHQSITVSVRLSESESSHS